VPALRRPTEQHVGLKHVSGRSEWPGRCLTHFCEEEAVTYQSQRRHVTYMCISLQWPSSWSRTRPRTTWVIALGRECGGSNLVRIF